MVLIAGKGESPWNVPGVVSLWHVWIERSVQIGHGRVWRVCLLLLGEQFHLLEGRDGLIDDENIAMSLLTLVCESLQAFE